MSIHPILLADTIDHKNANERARSNAIRQAAASLARRLRSEINILYVEDLKKYPRSEIDHGEKYEQWHLKHVKSLAAIRKKLPVKTKTKLRAGLPVDEIVKETKSKLNPELVIIGTQGRKGISRLLLGSVAEEVIRKSKRPVMVLGPVAQTRSHLFTLGKKPKILLATDLGLNSRAAERYAIALSKQIKGEITIFHCLYDYSQMLPQNFFGGGISVPAFGVAPLNFEEQVTHDLEKKVKSFESQGVRCNFKLDVNPVFSMNAVHKEASRYDLVIMGSHGRSALLNAYLGSTARETILYSSKPVIIVRSKK